MCILFLNLDKQPLWSRFTQVRVRVRVRIRVRVRVRVRFRVRVRVKVRVRDGVAAHVHPLSEPRQATAVVAFHPG